MPRNTKVEVLDTHKLKILTFVLKRKHDLYAPSTYTHGTFEKNKAWEVVLKYTASMGYKFRSIVHLKERIRRWSYASEKKQSLASMGILPSAPLDHEVNDKLEAKLSEIRLCLRSPTNLLKDFPDEKPETPLVKRDSHSRKQTFSDIRPEVEDMDLSDNEESNLNLILDEDKSDEEEKEKDVVEKEVEVATEKIDNSTTSTLTEDNPETTSSFEEKTIISLEDSKKHQYKIKRRALKLAYLKEKIALKREAKETKKAERAYYNSKLQTVEIKEPIEKEAAEVTEADLENLEDIVEVAIPPGYQLQFRNGKPFLIKPKSN